MIVFTAFAFLRPADAQQTLGSINGTVYDSSGAAVPNATVTVADSDIGYTRTTTASKSGFYQVFNLPPGTYKVTATHEGFETTDLVGIGVKEAQATTVNMKIKVGQVSTAVEVTANPLLNATDATNGYTMGAQQIQSTPLATGSFTQLAVLSPGVSAELLSGLDSNAGLGNQPIWANGQRDTSNTFQVNGVDVTNLFNGKSSSGSNSQRYNFNIGGGSTSASSSAGAATIGGANPVGTSVYGSNGNSLPSPPPEFLQELRVNTSMYDAQQGATSGAQIDANTISGTNKYHGQIYGTFANNSLNAAPYFFKQEALLTQQDHIGAFPSSLENPELHRWSTGATIGGPIKKDKLFFFAAYQFTYDSDESTGLTQMTVPSGLTDDRSIAGLDAAAESWAGGGTYTKAIDPTAFDLMNAKLPDGSFLIPSAQTPAAYAFGVPNVTLIGTSVFVSHQANAGLDYQVNSKDRLSGKYYYQNDPVTRPYGVSQTAGFPVTQENGAQVGVLDNTMLIGSRLNWEQRLGYVREFSYTYDQQTLGPDSVAGSAFTGQPNYGIGTGEHGVNDSVLPGLLLKEFASNSATDAPALKVGPYSNFMNVGFYQNRLNPSTNVIWAAGKHTLLAGGGYSYTQLNIEDQRNGLMTLTTKNFETFLQGVVASSAVLYSKGQNDNRNTANRYYRSNENDWYLQDKWQALPNLSITAGVRWDYHGGFTEKYGNMFNFDPSTYDVTGTIADGFTVNNSGFVVAGNNPNATQGATDSTLTGRQWGLSPRVGFAYSPKSFGNKVVVSGGAGIYYDRGELFTYLSQPAGNGSGGPFGVTESAPLANYVIGKGKTFAAPLGSAAAGGNEPTGSADFIKQQLQTVLGTGPGQASGYSGQAELATHPAFGQNCSGIDNQEDYTDCPDALNFGAYDKNNVLPYTINYTLKVQWQPRNDMSVLLGYVGSRGRHSVIPIPFNEPEIATASNPVHGETDTYGFEVLNQNSFTGYDYNPIPGEPWNSEDGGNADFRTPYIGYSPNAALFKTVGTSAYDALQAQVEKQMSHHLQAGLNYTWSHALDEQSDIGLFFTGDNPNKLRDSYASADFDRTHVFTANFMATLPDMARKGSALSYLANGWETTGIGIVQSGEPYSLYEFYGAVGSAYFGDYPTLLNPVLPISNAKNVQAALTGNSGKFRGTGGNYIPAIDPNDIAINYIQPGQKGVPVSTGTDPQDIYETDFVPGQRNLFRQALQKRLDLSIRKEFSLPHDRGLRFDFNIFNIFNTTSSDIPQDQTEIRQSSACSNSAISEGNNCSSDEYYVNYGQIVSSSDAGDQQSALTNLDQKPITSGSGKSTTIPLYLQPGQGSCTTSNTVPGASGCPNNGANFGSVTGTIGGSRAFTWGLHLTY